MQTKAKTVDEYLKQLPPDRREAIAAVREVVLANLDKDIEEGMQYGMIGWYVPHRVFPAGYHADAHQPLPYACIASQKNYMSLYVMSVYADGSDGEAWLRENWKATGKKLDMGKSCIRFKSADDLPLDLIGEAIRRVPAATHIEHYLKTVGARSKGKSGTNPKRANTK